MQEQELIAVRIKDGIFAGNVTAAEDREFLGMNKITHIINCAGGEIADYFVGDAELKYLSFPWKDIGSVCTTMLFDMADDNINRTVAFIDEAIATGNCVLVHSFYGVSRSPALIAAYFMVKYGWKLENALSFLEMAHPDVAIKPHFLRQLRTFAKRHEVQNDIFDRTVDDAHFGLDNDQWMLRNTLLNGLAFEEQQANELYKQCTAKVDVGARTGKKKRGRITFVDTSKGPEVEAFSTTPVVAITPVHHVDPTAGTDAAAASFVGSQGPVALKSGRRSPSILSRSTSPCPYRLESDPEACPKGRQKLALLPAAAPAAPPEVIKPVAIRSTNVSSDRPSSAAPTSIPESVRAPGGMAAADRPSSRPPPPPPAAEAAEAAVVPKMDYARLAPPVAHPPRTQFALKSGNKIRKGSPLPMQGNKKPKTLRKLSPGV
ncbi:dual specificity protein phosphatase, partial [Strigomonas culicis]